MRIWLRPDKVAQYNLTPSDIAAAIREQNSQFAAGRFGEEPMQNAQAFTYSVTTPGRLADPQAVREHHPALRRERRRAARSRTWRGSSSAR